MSVPPKKLTSLNEISPFFSIGFFRFSHPWPPFPVAYVMKLAHFPIFDTFITWVYMLQVGKHFVHGIWASQSISWWSWNPIWLQAFVKVVWFSRSLSLNVFIAKRTRTESVSLEPQGNAALLDDSQHALYSRNSKRDVTYTNNVLSWTYPLNYRVIGGYCKK